MYKIYFIKREVINMSLKKNDVITDGDAKFKVVGNATSEDIDRLQEQIDKLIEEIEQLKNE